MDQRPIAFLDVDGVISLFDAEGVNRAASSWHWIDGVVHRIDNEAGTRIRRLFDTFEVVWATGWEERANRYLPVLLELGVERLPLITFEGRAVFGSANWKVDAIGRYAGDRPVVWIDDNLDDTCRAWARDRRVPTLLIGTDPVIGLTDNQVEEAEAWAGALQPG